MKPTRRPRRTPQQAAQAQRAYARLEHRVQRLSQPAATNRQAFAELLAAALRRQAAKIRPVVIGTAKGVMPVRPSESGFDPAFEDAPPPAAGPYSIVLPPGQRLVHLGKNEMSTRAGCASCGEEVPADCPKSERPCGHHCNHSWIHDECCWCGKVWTAEDEPAL